MAGEGIGRGRRKRVYPWSESTDGWVREKKLPGPGQKETKLLSSLLPGLREELMDR